jgi:tRNA A-37 threonylcarbamoyl transferase component Bud32
MSENDPHATNEFNVPAENDEIDDLHEQATAEGPTVRLPRRAKRSTSEGKRIPPARVSAPTASQSMQRQEVARTLQFLWQAVLFSVVVLITVFGLEGDPTAKRIFLVALALSAVVCAVYAVVIRGNSVAYTLPRTLFCAYLLIATTFAGIYFFGVFSAAPAVVPLGLFFFSLTQSYRAPFSTFVACAVLQAAMTVGVVVGVLPDCGLIRGEGVSLSYKFVMLGLLELTFLGTYLVARFTRHAMLRAMELHEVAVRDVAQREALLFEARQQLERVLDVGGSGRFTDQELGSYRLGQIIGRGAMGEVYEATHRESGSDAAVKLLHRDSMENPSHLKRFLREARIAGGLDVEEVVRVLEIGGVEESPVPYIAMERLRGYDLAHLLRDRRALALERTCSLIRDVAKGLDAAHAEGIIHRDIKPTNLYWNETEDGGSWKILDFGVSTLMDEQGSLTRDKLVGTPSYMAPEQALGERVTPAADLFALGAIAFRCLTGHPPLQWGPGTRYPLPCRP